MAPILKLHLFGVPQIYLDDTPVTGFVTRKAFALFIYVATNRRVQPRSKLAALLWRDVAEKHAQNSLRRVLPNLRDLVGSHLRIDRQSVSFDEDQPFWMDVDLFRTTLTDLPTLSPQGQGAADLLNPAELENVLALYDRGFLDGFYVDDAPAFEEWVFLQRETLRELALRGFTYLAEHYLAHGNFTAGLAATQRLLTIEPWQETAHYQRMQIFAQSGQRMEALDQYEACRAMLAQEFGIQPSAAMTALYQQLKAYPSDGRTENALSPLTLPTPRSSLEAGVALSLPATPLPLVAPSPARQGQDDASTPGKALHSTSAPKVYWGEMPRPSFFAGRQDELTQLQRWLFEECCTLITILGVGGAGKTALAATLVRSLVQPTTHGGKDALLEPTAGEEKQPTEDTYSRPRTPHALAQPFTRILWRSLLNAPPLESVLRLWLQELSEHQLTSIPTDLDEQLSLLFYYLGQQRCLLVLDNLESILNAEEAAGQYRPDYEGYGVLIQRLGEVEHQSCVLLTSRELPLGVALLERSYPVVRTLRLDGLPAAVGIEVLRASGLQAGLELMQRVVQRYSGNPLALRLVAETVLDYYQGDVTNFLDHETLIFEDIRIVLDQQFRRLSALEGEIVYWLTIEREPISARQLALNFVQPPSHRALLEALRSLHRRSLVERDNPDIHESAEGEPAFSLQNVVLEYSTERLRDLIYAELVGDQLDYCLRYALVKAQATDYIRTAQSRLILAPIAQGLLENYGREGVADKLKNLVGKLRTDFALRPGYAAANVLHLAFQLGIKPEGWDFSQLTIWQADLRQGHLPYTNFSQAHFAHTAFMEKFDAILAVAVSPDGELCAAGGASGNVHLWRTSDGEQLSICRGRGRWVWSLAFSPNQTLLASGGSDGIVYLWDVKNVKSERAANEVSPTHQTMAGHTDAIFSLAFRRDGQWLASASADHTIRLWDVAHGELIQTLYGHTATVYGVAFSPDGHFLASTSRDHTVRLWQVATGECLQVLKEHHAQVVACRFSPDGQWLITASVDRMMQVWRVGTSEDRTVICAHFHHVLSNDAAELSALALSPGGDVIATNGPDATIRLWSRADGTILKTLHGHTENVQSLAFHPNGKTLVSGGWDQSVRFWDVATGYLLRTQQGYTNAVYALALSSDGQTLVSGNADGTLCRWSWGTPDLDRPHTGHSGSVKTLAFHPDGQLLASGGSDRAIRLWDVVDGQLTERKALYGQRGGILQVAFSPDGRLIASSAADQTVYLWNTSTGGCRQVLRGARGMMQALVFSPDGTQLVGGSSDGQIYRWQLTSEREPAQDAITTPYSAQPFATIPGECTSLAFSPDGALLAGSGPDHVIFLWRAWDGEKLLSIETPVNSTVYAVVFRPHQATCLPHLASSSGTGAICFWTIDLARGLHHLNYTRTDHRGSVRSLHFTPDGQTLVSGGADETIRLWEAESGTCLATLPLQQPYVGMKMTNATGLTAAQRAGCKALGALGE